MTEVGRRRIDVEAVIEKSAARSGEFDFARSRRIAKGATPSQLDLAGERKLRGAIRVGEAYLESVSTIEQSAGIARNVADLRENHRAYVNDSVPPNSLSERTDFVGLLITSARIQQRMRRILAYKTTLAS